MAFVNKYISEDDIKKYDLDTLDKKSEGYKRSWTIDRSIDTWLIHLDTGKENDGVRWLFFWKSKVYRIRTRSVLARQYGMNYDIRTKIIELYDAHWHPASGFDATEFFNALKSAMETRKAYGMANTDLQNNMVYHVELALGE